MSNGQFRKLRRVLAPENRVRFFVALAVLLAIAFAVTTWRTARAEREKALFGTCLYAQDAARVLGEESRVYLEAVANPIFAAIGGRAPLARGTPLPAPAALKAADIAAAACHCAPRLESRGYFRLDFNAHGSAGALFVETGVAERVTLAVNTETASSPTVIDRVLGVEPVRLREAVARLKTHFATTGVVAAAITSSPGDTGALQAVAILNPKYSVDGELLAVYGLLIAPRTFATQVIAPEFEREPLFAPMFAARGIALNWRDSGLGLTPNGKLVNLAVLDLHRTTLYQTGPIADTASTAPGCVAVGRIDPTLARLMLHISPPLDVYGRWVQSSLVEAYVPFLVTIIVAMLASVGAAVVGARREAELARLRADFVSSVSHELRMPLAQILMSGETLRLRRTRSHAEHDAEADSIVREALRLTRLVDNALVFSRIEHHNLRITPRPVELRGLVDEAISNLCLVAKGQNVRITNSVPRDLYPLLDPSALRQVLLNLLDNALKYGPTGQEILVGAAPAPDGSGPMTLWVDDEGPGVPPAAATQIFEPFVRLDRDRNVGVAGSGLGLSIVRHIVQQHGGRVHVEHSCRRAGSRFVVELPAAIPVDSRPRALSSADEGES
jgi:signal transduction histidine kinase